MKIHNDFASFLKSHENDVFTYWVYRKMFTPYEQQNAFTDESVFEDTYASYGKIFECVPLSDGDYLIGFHQTNDPLDDEPVLYSCVEYYRLSEIRLNYNVRQQEE